MLNFENSVNVVRQNWLVFCAALVTALTLFGLIFLVGLIVVKGIGHFWIQPLAQINYQTDVGVQVDFGYVQQHSKTVKGEERLWLSRDSFQYSRPEQQKIIVNEQIIELTYPENIHYLRLSDGRDFYVKPGVVIVGGIEHEWGQLTEFRNIVDSLLSEKRSLQLGPLARVHNALDDLARRKVMADAPASKKLEKEYEDLKTQVMQLEAEIAKYQIRVQTARGLDVDLALAEINHILHPNRLSQFEKFQTLLQGLGHFLTDSAKDANQAGGVFPAIFGTVLMVLLMTIIVAPLGIIAAIYLTEYAPNNAVIMTIRIAVSNLAGVPSVVYGVFGLGFFVYQVGGNIDALFYADQLPSATFGSPGLLWASLTMALLTLPVVIVAAEEGLRRVPKGLRNASYALGATKFETIRKIVLPVASSSLMTGIILAIARGAGEVAPMLMVGAVKYAPSLPIDGEFPFIHLERQFMHLGVLIYDGAFHGQVIQDGSTMMFAACLLLLLVVSLLNMVAIVIRNKLQNRYRTAHYV